LWLNLNLSGSGNLTGRCCKYEKIDRKLKVLFYPLVIYIVMVKFKPVRFWKPDKRVL